MLSDRLGSRTRGDDESGFVIVFVALTLVVCMTFVAFAIDVGAGLSERRQDQTAADSASLAGVQLLSDGARAAADEAARQVAQNLKQSYTAAEWKAMWGGCTDSSRPAEYALDGIMTDPTNAAATLTTKCISFNRGLTKMRVRVPRIPVETSFAGVIGVNQLFASAAAEAEVDQVGILPFGVIASGASSSESCLKSGPNGHDGTAPCAGSDSGNFGWMDSPIYGDGASSVCTGDGPDRLVFNTVHGIDHEMDQYRESPDEMTEAARLDECYTHRPNQMKTQTGNMPNVLMDAFVRGSGGVAPGRLARYEFEHRTVANHELDDRPLWEYITSGLVPPSVPQTCVREHQPTTWSKARMRQCLDEYIAAGSTTPLFTRDDTDPGDGRYDIELSKRLAFVPEFHPLPPPATGWGTGTEFHLVKAFRVVFIQTLFFGCNGNRCNAVYNPGETGTGALEHATQLDSVTAFLLKDGMLPSSIIETGPGAKRKVGRLIK